ncbi:hypothetical protein DERP_011872 [Dermatophagoides pteronyssinus]|uniref:Uncharacterized protein n=1 Tax=Dermatophagoides pteronyssinus TaxID=6956 RepID=A0ABQ8JRE1_DERPT|nr:hypothetical protein DERP_011872 [Dermatophagoides pteronyssinus]
MVMVDVFVENNLIIFEFLYDNHFDDDLDDFLLIFIKYNSFNQLQLLPTVTIRLISFDQGIAGRNVAGFSYASNHSQRKRLASSYASIISVPY